MRAIMTARHWRLALALSFVALAAITHAIPNYITVSGALVDSADKPMSGNFPMQISFFDSNTSTTPIAISTVTITVDKGLFGAAVAVPEDLMTLEQAFYSISIDTGKNGFDANDRFGGMNEISSVPFAMSGIPEKFFETSGGHNIDFFGSGSGTFIRNTLVLVPFSTPPGGVHFNRIGLRAIFGGTSSYGIYDEDGDLVLSTDGRAPDVIGDPFVFFISGDRFPGEGRLKPSKMYYAAYTSNSDKYTSVRTSSVPTLPNMGRIDNGGVNGKLPVKIDLKNMKPIRESEPTLSFGLYHVDPDSPTALREKAGIPQSELAPEIQQMIKSLEQ